MCVLFVDDEPMLRDVVSDYLTDLGFDVVTAGNGAEAVALIDHSPCHFTALLTDLNMPGLLSGLDVARCMKAAHPEVPIFIVTGRPDLLDGPQGRAPEYGVIPKPFKLKQIGQRLAGLSRGGG